MSALDEAKVRAKLDGLAKPPHSLGRLEDIACRLAVTQQTLRPRSRDRRLVVFGADHGVVGQGVSAWPADVTAAMLSCMNGGGAACSVLARATDTELRVVDVGSRAGVARPHASPSSSHVLDRRVAAGTDDLSRGAAMDVAQFEQAWQAGREQADDAAASGIVVAAGGEVGIGNTTSAACLAALLLDMDAEDVVGPGAGADRDALARKRLIVSAAVTAARDGLTAHPRKALAAVAGFELVALAGFYATAADRGLCLVLDGVVATAAALMAERLAPGTARQLIAAHRSPEPAHAPMLDALSLRPYLDWGLRLGEGTGALLLMPLLDAACAMLHDMASLESVQSQGAH